MPSGQGVILSVSHDQPVLETREAVLRSVGWDVISTMDDVEAISLAVEENVDLVVLGDSIDATERVFLAQTIKRMNAKLQVVMLYREDDGTRLQHAADAHIEALSSPQLLIDTIRQLLNEKAQSQIAS
jgi:DNA-binding response OmpR family regulator